MVQDVSAETNEDDDGVLTPGTTPGMSPYGNGNGGDDYFTSTPKRQSSFASLSRGYSGSCLTRKESIKKKPRKPLSRLHTELLLRMVLHDAQTRLVFRAQALIRADVEYYVAKEGDLDYPDKIAAGSSAIDDSWRS